MEFALPWPVTQGEWLAWSSAVVTVLFGLLLLFGPRLSLRILRLQTVENHPEAVSEARATMSGFYLGVGLCCIAAGLRLRLYRLIGACERLSARSMRQICLKAASPTCCDSEKRVLDGNRLSIGGCDSRFRQIDKTQQGQRFSQSSRLQPKNLPACQTREKTDRGKV